MSKRKDSKFKKLGKTKEKTQRNQLDKEHSELISFWNKSTLTEKELERF